MNAVVTHDDELHYARQCVRELESIAHQLAQQMVDEEGMTPFFRVTRNGDEVETPYNSGLFIKQLPMPKRWLP